VFDAVIKVGTSSCKSRFEMMVVVVVNRTKKRWR
jgi:hypothetical protein